MALTDDLLAAGEGLWANGRDSIKHALDHFSERNQARANREHHDKWIVLSVHHAAECVCNMHLIQLEPDNAQLVRRGSAWFPSLSDALRELQHARLAGRISPAERKLFALLNELPNIRHQFAHRVAPAQLDVSIAAMCMIGLLKYLERHRGESASDIVWQSPPIEGDVVTAIRYKRLQEYGDFIELFLRDKYGDRWLPACPACRVQAVVSARCEACFTELECVECPNCLKEGYYIDLEYATRGTVQIECQYCGLTHTI